MAELTGQVLGIKYVPICNNDISSIVIISPRKNAGSGLLQIAQPTFGKS